MFSWLVIVSFNSQLITYMTQIVVIPPFESLETLLDNSEYVILAEKDSIVQVGFQVCYNMDIPFCIELIHFK